ncbi:hypothetical protein NMD88_03760 [Edwardsiella tarda]|uniref:hypothetical protein n=1 Tax=Edwardsiella tarda TaxID=636 RepID=UPI00351C488A
MNMREEFEKWFKEKFEVPDFVFSDFDESAGEYGYTDETEELYINITMMFEAWKDAQQKWIKCSEPPKEECSVLLLDSNQVVWTGIYFPDDGGFQLDLGDDRDVTFTHYMLTPNPPEE